MRNCVSQWHVYRRAKTFVFCSKTNVFAFFTGKALGFCSKLCTIVPCLSLIHKLTKLGIEIMHPFVYNVLVVVPDTPIATSGRTTPSRKEI